MKYLSFLVILAFFGMNIHAQDYPFQNTSLNDSARITNLISLMNS